jgi:hypothetical protein
MSLEKPPLVTSPNVLRQFMDVNRLLLTNITVTNLQMKPSTWALIPSVPWITIVSPRMDRTHAAQLLWHDVQAMRFDSTSCDIF